MEYSNHSLILLIGIAVAGLALFGAFAVGPYGPRGVRPILVLMSFAAALGTGFYFITYLGFIEQRRTIETRLSELRAQAMNAGSTLACLERSGDAVDTACGQKLFTAPEALAAANAYTAALVDVLTEAARYSGPRTPQFDDTVAGLERSLRQDPFGLTANILMVREGCTADRCAAIALFKDPARLWSNIRTKTFDANVARYAAAWRAPTSAATPPGALPIPGAAAASGTETRAPIPDKYALPSAASIPPVSIMNDEPQDRPATARAKDRAASPAQQPSTATGAEQPSDSAPAALPAPSPAAAADKPAPARRQKSKPNAPLSLTPPQ